MANKWSANNLSFGQGDFHREVFYQPSAEALPKVEWKMPRVQDLPSWADAKRISVDVECKDPQLADLGPGVRRKGNFVCGVAVAIEDGPDFYLPIAHAAGDNCDWDVWGYVREQMKLFKGLLVNCNIGYDLDWLAENGVDCLDKNCAEIQALDVLLDENQLKYNLNSICERMGLPGKDEAVLRQAAAAYRVDPKTEMWKMAGRFVDRYARMDARRALQALRRQEAKIAEEDKDVGEGKQGTADIWRIEQRVTPLLVKMRRRGVRVDPQRLEQIERQAYDVEAECLAKVRHATGVNVNVGDVWKGDVLAHALRVAGFTPGKTAKGKDSIDKEFLNECGEIGKWMLRAREWNKLRTTFCQQTRDYAIISGDGEWRIHSTFNQSRTNDEKKEDDREDKSGKGVRYGRLSSEDPNVQQQPSRHEEYGGLWRSIYVADRGALWGCSDWSQQEPRIACHYAEELSYHEQYAHMLRGAREFAEEYRKNPKLDIHTKLAEISGIKRKIVKNQVNGRLYGMGDLKLCIQLGQPTVKKWSSWKKEYIDVPGPEGQAMIDEFKKYAPWIPGLCKIAAEAAEKRGYVRTRLGRKCHFYRDPVSGRVFKAYKAFNRIGQGEAADMMKLSLVMCEDAGIPIQMSVHDEFDFSFTDFRKAREVSDIQRNAVKYRVPMNVDLEIGENWADLSNIDEYLEKHPEMAQ